MGGGGGDSSGMQMMMMIAMQQQMEQQRREQQAQYEKQAFEAAQRGETQNYTRYQDEVTAQNKKVGDVWSNYNYNLEKIKKLNPQYNAHQTYNFTPYAVDPSYHKSTNTNEANANQDLLNKWYGDLDKKSLDDYNYAKGQYDQSKNWLTDVQSQTDAQNRLVPGALPGAWGAGGGNVSGGAGADSLVMGKPDGPGGFVDGQMPGDVFSGIGAAAGGGAQPPASGFIGSNAQAPKNNLASVFVGATNPSKASAGSTIF
jgi:hypothetical protein